MKRLSILFYSILAINITFGQNRVWDQPTELGKKIFLDAGNGKTLIIADYVYNNDSTHIHVLSADADMNLSHLSGFRLEANITTLNDATRAGAEIYIGGSNIGGFGFTKPYILKIGGAGTVIFSGYFSNLGEQDQIHSVHVNNSDMDLFTTANVFDTSFYFINGNIIGQFPSALQVAAPSDIGFRVHDTAPTENDHEYMVVCQADTSLSESKFLIVMRLDTSGVQWAFQHDHGTTMNSEIEQGNDLQQISDGNWIYTAAYRGTNGLIEQRLVKMDGTGSVLWSKEYFYNSDKMRINGVHETSDGGFLMTTVDIISNEYYVNKLDSSGVVLWTQKYVQGNTNFFPIVSFLKNDQDQLYGYSFISIAEMDEDINVCDMYLSSGITHMDVTFDVVPVSVTSTSMLPNRLPMPFELRSKNFINSQVCIYDGINENMNELDLLLFPDPTHTELNVDLSNVYGNVDVEIFDLQGRSVRIDSMFGGSIQKINVESLRSSIYMIVIQTESGISRQRFVKE